MRRLLLLLVLVSIIGFGCIEEKGYPSANAERLVAAQSVDLDADGSPDYMVYGFAPVALQDVNMTAQRQVTVAIETNATYSAINENITDVDLLIADQSLDEFSKSRTQSDTACSNSIGLMNVVCSDAATCSRLCSSASVRCKRIASAYEDALAGAMISYVQDNNEIRSLILDARRKVVTLRSAPESEHDDFLQKTRSIVYKIASINANPLYTDADLALCEHSDFGISDLIAAAGMVGNYSAANTSYTYRVIISLKPTQQKASGQIGVEVGGVTFTDRLPRSAVPHADSISSIQEITTTQDQLNTVVSLVSQKTANEGYMLIYEFKSDQPPQAVIQYLKNPELKIRRINLSALIPVNFLYAKLAGIISNYYIAIGLTAGIVLSALLVVYNAFVLLLTLISEKAAGASLVMGFRRAFGRTDVRWKTDALLAILFLGAGIYISTFMAQVPLAPPSLMDSLDFLLKTDMGLLGTAFVAIGFVLAYLTLDNFAKITILEKAYGMVIKQEKDMFLAKVAALKDRMAQLTLLIDEYGKEDFDISKEYDVLTSMKAENIDALSKDMTGRTKALIEEDLSKVENAASSLKERKRIADENWQKWKDAISKALEEQGEVHPSSLVTVPASLRAWALARYAKEAGTEGVSMDREVLKRKKISAESLVRDMINKGLLKGAIVIKQDKIVTAEFAEGSGTVVSVLALKLRMYLQSLAKNIGQHAPQSFVAIGDKQVMVLMKGRNIESLLFINKPRFNEAVEQWKAGSKSLDEA
jgi:hypothetical protein